MAPGRISEQSQTLPCCIYVLGDDGGPWKIGFSNNPKARLRDVVRNYPGEHLATRAAKVVFKSAWMNRSDAYEAERAIHRTLHPMRVRWPGWGGGMGIRSKTIEWFDAPLETVRLAVERELSRREGEGAGDE